MSTITSITHSECVSVALVTQHAKRIRRIILSSAACLAVPYCYNLRGHGGERIVDIVPGRTELEP